LPSALARVHDLMFTLTRASPGPCGAIAARQLRPPGELLRAWLALEACRALEIPEEAAVAWGAACELLFSASLVHRDIQVGDHRRRGQPTVWIQHGAPQAINVGDLLMALPIEALARAPLGGDACWHMARALASVTHRVARGQALALSGQEERRLSWGDYLEAARCEASLLALPVVGAALAAGRQDAQALAAPFETLGVVDRLLGELDQLTSTDPLDESAIRQGRLSAPVALYLERYPRGRAALTRALDEAQAGSEAAMRAVRSALISSDIDQHLDACIRQLAVDALDSEALLFARGMREVAGALCARLVPAPEEPPGHLVKKIAVH
jgi:geranylgeranyl pyrophosphate synthase